MIPHDHSLFTESFLDREAGTCRDTPSLAEQMREPPEVAAPDKPYLLCIRGTHDEAVVSLVTVRPDGTIEFGPHYHPDDAAQEFWSHLQDHGRSLYTLLTESRERERVLMEHWVKASEAHLLADARAEILERMLRAPHRAGPSRS